MSDVDAFAVSWTQRWWRLPGESLLVRKVGAAKVSVELAWCGEDEWGVRVLVGNEKTDIGYDLQARSLIGHSELGDDIHDAVEDALLGRISSERPANDNPVLDYLAQSFDQTEWVSGKQLRKVKNLSVNDFQKLARDLMPRWIRRRADDERDSYSLTLPGLLHLEPKVKATRLLEGIYRAIAHRFESDETSRYFSRGDLEVFGVRGPAKRIRNVINIALLAASPADESEMFELPSDDEMIAEAVRRGDSFIRYLLHAANESHNPHFAVKRPWPTAPLAIARDNLRADYVPIQYIRARLPSEPRLDSATSVTDATVAQTARYTFGNKLGEGTIAEVWKATDQFLKRDVAVKFIVAPGENDALAHARALARVTHASIVSVYEVTNLVNPETGTSSAAIIMELVSGTPLVEILGTKVAPDEMKRIGVAVLGALGAYHKAGLAHLDVHDGNVVVGKETVKLVDPLYYETAAFQSTIARTKQQARDVRQARDILVQLLYAGGVPIDAAQTFERLTVPPTLERLHHELERALSAGEHAQQPAATIQQFPHAQAFSFDTRAEKLNGVYVRLRRVHETTAGLISLVQVDGPTREEQIAGDERRQRDHDYADVPGAVETGVATVG